MRRISTGTLALTLLAVAYLIWAGLFIYQSSYIALDGHRYFGLFDDAMISMRYAWNFAHGNGLVWNVGQRLEGYSNLLMTLLMSLAALLLDKSHAVLAIQLIGVPVMLLIAWFARRIALEVLPDDHYRTSIAVLVFAGVLLYYPLSYWTLMGMETGILTLLLMAGVWFGFRWLRSNKWSDLAALSAVSGLAFLTRNDAVLLAAVIFAYLGLELLVIRKQASRFRALFMAGLAVLLFPLAQSIFRLAYYGEILPNTYFLKLTGIPLMIRLIGGTRFVLEFLGQTWPLFFLAALGIFLHFQINRVFLAALMVAAIAYQIYAGGDPWESWRLLSPAMPALILLAFEGALLATRRLLPRITSVLAPVVIVSGLAVLALAWADQPFFPDMAVQGPTSAAIANRVNTNAALAINALTAPTATIGVIWAGTLPYYADRVGVDFLGKSDSYIAHLPADITGSVSWGGMISVPGHNKYDLNYSILKLQPTYIQVYSWGYETVKPWVEGHYLRLDYQGVAGSKTIWLLKGSPLVCWDACKSHYTIVPWSTGQN